jgi:hypothetical protein
MLIQPFFRSFYKSLSRPPVISRPNQVATIQYLAKDGMVFQVADMDKALGVIPAQ